MQTLAGWRPAVNRQASVFLTTYQISLALRNRGVIQGFRSLTAEEGLWVVSRR